MTSAGLQTPFVPGPIMCGRDFPLSDVSSAQPIMTEAVLDWFRPISIGVVTATPQNGADDATQDGVVVETTRWVSTSGCWQPGAPEKLEVLAGGERSWDNGILHTTPDFNVPTDTKLIVRGLPYRVMSKLDYSANGYCRYELVEDYARSS